MSERRKGNRPNINEAIRRSVDISTAILLFSGQVTIIGVFAVPKGLYVSVTGPILNGTRLQGKSQVSNTAIDVMDIVVALLLVLGELSVYGPFIGPGTMSIAITGPPFGVPIVPRGKAPTRRVPPQAAHFYGDFQQQLIQRFVMPIQTGRR